MMHDSGGYSSIGRGEGDSFIDGERAVFSGGVFQHPRRLLSADSLQPDSGRGRATDTAHVDCRLNASR
jgi:hypothetical protein